MTGRTLSFTVYDPPARTARALWFARHSALVAAGEGWVPLIGPIRLSVTAWLPQPASMSKRDRLTARPIRRPDLDNFLKTCLDGLSPVWLDDSQVVELTATKRYAIASPPRWELTVETLAWP